MNTRGHIKEASEAAGIPLSRGQAFIKALEEIAVRELDKSGEFFFPGACRLKIDVRPPRRTAWTNTSGSGRGKLPARTCLRAKPIKRLRDEFSFDLEDRR